MNSKKILITGGTGSLGSELTRKWANEGHTITVVSRDPHKQAALSREVPSVAFILSDICNVSEMRRACEGQDVLVHTAALKQVDSGEFHPQEFVRVNICGSIAIADAWALTHGTYDNKVLLISSDKAVSALNTYGASKKIAEAVFRKYDYSVLRYGNVVSSAGSFLNIWADAIRKGKPISLRTPDSTRFFLTMANAVKLVEDALRIMAGSLGGQIFVPHSLRAFSIRDMASFFAQTYGCEILQCSILPYEKLHEVLVTGGEKPVKVSDQLCKIIPSWDVSDSEMKQFCSETAPRVSAQDVVDNIAGAPCFSGE